MDNTDVIKFQIDTGSDVNVLPLNIYKAATRDEQLMHVMSSVLRTLTSYSGNKVKVVGQVRLHLTRFDKHSNVLLYLVDGATRPILGKRDCVTLNIIQRLDTDQHRQPSCGKMNAMASDALTLNGIFKAYSDVFADKIGELDQPYTIRPKQGVTPVQQAPRSTPVLLRPLLKQTLDSMTADGIIAPISEPTPWISSLVGAPKKGGKLRICQDPQHLNAAITQENYVLPTIEEVSTNLHGTRYFTVFDLKKRVLANRIRRNQLN